MTKLMAFNSVLGLVCASLLVITIGKPSPSRELPYNKSKLLSSFQADYDGGDYDSLIEKAEHALNYDPNDTDVLLALASTYAMKGSVGFAEAEVGAKAIDYVDRLLYIDPDNSEAYRIKGYTYEIQELYEQAHENYDIAIKLNPNNFQAFSNKAHAYDLQGDLIQAEKFYLLSQKINPNAEHLLINLARLYSKQGKDQEAKQSLSTLLSTSKNLSFQAGAYQILAEIYKSEDDYESANLSISSALALDPNLPQAWVSKGRILLNKYLQLSTALEAQELLESVQSCAERALAININQASAYALLSRIEAIKENTAKSEEYKTLALNAIDLDITLGGREKKALRDLLQAVVVLTSGSVEEAAPNIEKSQSIRIYN